MYHNILVAVELSPEAKVITEKARRGLADLHQARLSLINVVEYSNAYPPAVGIPDQVGIKDTMLEHARVSLQDLALTHGLKEAKRYVEIGIASEEILRVAEDNEVDLIIIGSHGKHGIRLLLGSTANTVLHHAKCDVLAIRVGS